MDDNPLGELCKGVVDISKCNILNREFIVWRTFGF